MKVSFLGRILLLIAPLIMGTFVLINSIGSRIKDNLVLISSTLGRKELTALIQEAISEVGIDEEKTFLLQAESMIRFDTVYLNTLLKDVTRKINKTLVEELSFGNSRSNLGYRFEIPLGLAYDNPFLINFGPDLPVLFELKGDFESGLTTEVQEFGLNNALISIKLSMKFKIALILPLAKSLEEFLYEAPISYNLFKGEVPFGSGKIQGVNKIIGAYSLI